MGLRTAEGHEAYRAHESFYKSQKKLRPDILVVENVTEYSLERVQEALGSRYACRAMRLDPRIFGFATSRARVYIIAWRVDVFEWASDISYEAVVVALRRRPVMDVGKYFFKKLPEEELPSAWYVSLSNDCVCWI